MDPFISLNDTKKSLIKQLIAAGCYKTGEFTIKSGSTSSYYVDLRLITMHQEPSKTIVGLINEIILKIKEENKSREVAVVGVPYGVVPVAAVAAYESNSAYYPVRKETKDYGNKQITNEFNNFSFILVEDVMSTGGSIVDTIKKLGGKRVTDVIVIVDREHGGENNLRAEFPNIKLHSIVKVSDFIKSPYLVDKCDGAASVAAREAALLEGKCARS